MLHLVRISSKAPDVFLDPFQGQALILQAHVAGNDVIVEAQEAQDAEPIVEGHLWEE